MTSKEKRAEKIKNIIQLLFKETSMEKYQKQINIILSKDTNNTLKLYRYRKFDEKEHNLDSLKTGTIRCSMPSEFNDPFDSKIGMSIQIALQKKYREDLIQIELIINSLLKIYKNETSIDECDESIKGVVERLLKNKKVKFLIHKFNEFDKKNKKELNNFVENNVSILIDFMKNVIEHSNTSSDFKVSMNYFIQTTLTYSDENKVKILTSASPLKVFAEIQNIESDRDETDLMLEIAKKYSNDTSEIKNMELVIENAYRQIEEVVNNKFFIGCLTTEPKNRLMWSHYSKDHSGFCVEYDFSKWDSVLSSYYLLPIAYSQEMPQVSWENAISKTPEAQQKFLEEFLSGLLIKDDIWKYENEWRILVPQTKGRFCEMPPISCIYLGSAIGEENKQKVLKIAKEKNIPVKQMKIDRCKYELHAVDIDN